MKNTYRSILTVVALAVFTASTATAQAEDYLYETNNGTINIIFYIGTGGDVVIPATINGLPVTIIGDQAFLFCTSLASVAIPNSVTSIGEEAFSRCTSLMSITVDALNPAYSSLQGVLFDKSRTTLIWCPEGKTGSYTIPGSVTNIGQRAFGECSSLTSVSIPDSVISIGESAFWGCTRLTSVTTGNNVTYIGWGAFEGCTGLASVTIGNSVTSCHFAG